MNSDIMNNDPQDVNPTLTYEELLSALNEIRSVTDHLNEVCQRLGVRCEPPSLMPADKVAKCAAPEVPMPIDSLVAVLDMLPRAIAKEAGLLHSKLSELQNSLY